MTDHAADVTVAIPTRNRSGLLRNAIESVLGQTYDRFEVLVSDNASEDDTAAVVASFDDPRLIHHPVEEMISRPANFNRAFELADTEFVLLLSDDDWLHPDHLSSTVAAMKRWPSVGMAHSGYTIVDGQGNELVAHAGRRRVDRPTVFEPGDQFIERTLRTGSTVCLASALFRKAALVGGGGMHPEDGDIDDLFLMMRIATDWDVAYLDQPLAVLRAHDDASSSSYGWFTANGLRSARSLSEILYANRRRFLGGAGLPEADVRRLTRIVERRHRKDVLGHLSMRSNTGDGRRAVMNALGAEIRRDHSLLVEPATARFLVGQILGRRLRLAIRRALNQRSGRSAGPSVRAIRTKSSALPRAKSARARQ
jgi:glycosyltransferase involved in cell wall biosynthesis